MEEIKKLKDELEELNVTIFRKSKLDHDEQFEIEGDLKLYGQHAGPLFANIE